MSRPAELSRIPSLLAEVGKLILVPKSANTYQYVRQLLRGYGFGEKDSVTAYIASREGKLYIWLTSVYNEFRLNEEMKKDMDANAMVVVQQGKEERAVAKHADQQYSQEDIDRLVAERLPIIEKEMRDGDRIEKKDPAKCRKAVENYMKPSEE